VKSQTPRTPDEWPVGGVTFGRSDMESARGEIPVKWPGMAEGDAGK
jgi:hypothetical protein